jgi:hypothetical protein
LGDEHNEPEPKPEAPEDDTQSEKNELDIIIIINKECQKRYPSTLNEHPAVLENSTVNNPQANDLPTSLNPFKTPMADRAILLDELPTHRMFKTRPNVVIRIVSLRSGDQSLAKRQSVRAQHIHCQWY